MCFNIFLLCVLLYWLAAISTSVIIHFFKNTENEHWSGIIIMFIVMLIIVPIGIIIDTILKMPKLITTKLLQKWTKD